MKKILVMGSNGGIGSAFVEYCTNQRNTVIGLSRNDCDLTSEESIQMCVNKLKEHAPFDIILLATGLLHTDKIKPEKTIKQLNSANLKAIFEINSFGPILFLKNCLSLLHKDKRSVFATISARVGSISDNRLGGWYSYRSSKAALNMLLKTASIELARTHPHLIIAGLHPGTVDTKLSKPFQSHVPPMKLFTPLQSAKMLFEVIQALTPENSGYCFAWDGQKIAF